MKMPKLTACNFFLLALILGLSSCEREAEKQKVNVYTKTDIIGSGAQIAPDASPSPGLAKLSVHYDKRTKVLNYTIEWSGLTDSVIAIRLNGPAPVGYSALNLGFQVPAGDSAKFATTPYTTLQQTLGSDPKALAPPAGSFKGSLIIDDLIAKEQDLLNHYYYLTLHTKSLLPIPGAGRFLLRWFGEVRAQIVFQ